MKNEISNKVLETIKDEKIKPKSKWEFLVKDSLIWGVAVVSVIVGGLAISVMIFLIKNSFTLKLENCKLISVLYFVPYFWVVILLIFLVLAYFNFKYTKNGYKQNPYIILVLSIVISIIVGSVNYAVGFGEKIEEVFYSRVPVYQKIMHDRMKPLANPKDGVLMGIVITKNERGLMVMDFDMQKWQVNIPLEHFHLLPEMPNKARIVFLGEVVDDFVFDAKMMKPLLESRKLKLLFEGNERKYLQPRTN